MSYIHDILTKAQKEKDNRRLMYSGIMTRENKFPKIVSYKVILVVFVLMIGILFIFKTFSWLDTKEEKAAAILLQADKLTEKTAFKLPQRSLATEASFSKGTQFYKKGRFRQAKKQYQDVLRLDSKHIQALNNLGVIYIQEKKFIAAQKNLKKAIIINPNYVDPYYNLACLYAIRGEVPQSLSYLKKAIKLNPSVRYWAQQDRDLKDLRTIPQFKEMIQMEAVG